MLRNLVRRSTLTHYSAFNHRPLLPSLRRHCSSKREPIEIELDFSSPSGLKNMEEMMQRLIAQKVAPDWLPFIPGASFWVPPPHRGSEKVVDLMEKLSYRLPEEEELSLTTDREIASTDGIATLDVEMKSPEHEEEGMIEVVVFTNSKNMS